MPNFDGTGPDGEGPMTGRGRGYCAIPIAGPEQELRLLSNQTRLLQTQLKIIRARIKSLETNNTVYK